MLNPENDFNAASGCLRLKQPMHLAKHLSDFDRRQDKGRRAGQAQELPDEVLQPVQFPMDDFEAAGEFVFGLRSHIGQVLFEQLDMNIERTERIPDFVR
jgi:hypothetical protein